MNRREPAEWGENSAEQVSVLRERIAEALRLHPKYYLNSLGMIGEPWRPGDNMTGREKLWCGNCVEPWPCPTAIALGVQS